MRNKKIRAVTVVCVATALAGMTVFAHADPIAIANYSFELPVTPPDSFIVDAPPDDWTAYGSLTLTDRVVGVVNPAGTTLYVEAVPDGSNLAVTFLENFSGSEAGIEQTLFATLQPLTQYVLSVEVGNMASYVGPPAYDFDGFPGYRVELLAGGVVIAMDANSVLPAEGGFLTSTVQLAVGEAHAQLGELLGVRLVNLDAAAGVEVNFDDVRLDATPVECPAVPWTGCKTAAAGRGSLSFVTGAGDPEKKGTGWSWKGQATTLLEFGSPLSTTSYLFCVYDGGDQIVSTLRAPAGGSCDGDDCWKASSSGFRYKDKSGSAIGLTSLQLKPGADGKSSIKIKGRGALLELPTLPLVQAPAAVRALLRNEESGDCWEASYGTVLGDPTSTSKWKARND